MSATYGEKKQKVKYWWTADGECEVCEITQSLLEETAQCYHCATTLEKGSKVSKLVSVTDNCEYALCPLCADDSTEVIKEEA